MNKVDTLMYSVFQNHDIKIVENETGKEITSEVILKLREEINKLINPFENEHSMTNIEQNSTSENQETLIMTEQEKLDAAKRKSVAMDLAHTYLDPIFKNYNIDIVRDTAASDIFRLFTNILMDLAQENRNTDYYRNIVVEVGKLFGPTAYTSADGSIQDDVLCAKVFELVHGLFEENQKIYDENRKIKDKNAELQEILANLNTNSSPVDNMDESAPSITHGPELGLGKNPLKPDTVTVDFKEYNFLRDFYEKHVLLEKANQNRRFEVLSMLTSGISQYNGAFGSVPRPISDGEFNYVLGVINHNLRQYQAISNYNMKLGNHQAPFQQQVSGYYQNSSPFITPDVLTRIIKRLLNGVSPIADISVQNIDQLYQHLMVINQYLVSTKRRINAIETSVNKIKDEESNLSFNPFNLQPNSTKAPPNTALFGTWSPGGGGGAGGSSQVLGIDDLT